MSLFNFLDKTLNLLKTGAKTLSYKLNTSAQMDSIDLPPLRQLSPCKLKSTSNLKQMLLTDKLQLKVSNKIMNVSCIYDCYITWPVLHDSVTFVVLQDIRMDLCGCCRLIDQSISKCYYCDQILCSSCLFTCTGCSETFCQNCSLSM